MVVTVSEWGGEPRQPTVEERACRDALDVRLPGLDYWLHADPDGRPWMLVSMDIVRRKAVVATPRMDVDRRGARGGYSPGYLNWDDGVRAEHAGIDTSEAPGAHFDAGAGLVEQVASWFEARRAESSRKPWFRQTR
ncbi:hypothetical protein GCM10028777_02200 [Angustibacter speluncae]